VRGVTLTDLLNDCGRINGMLSGERNTCPCAGYMYGLSWDWTRASALWLFHRVSWRCLYCYAVRDDTLNDTEQNTDVIMIT